MIELRNVKKIYTSKKAQDTIALDNLNLKIGNKGMVFIVGTSGSGKSTLLNVLGGLDGISSGKILVNGKNISDFKSKEYDSFRNTYVGFIFQDFNILDQYNVYENIELSLKLQNKKANRNEIDKLLQDLGIENLGNRRINELSGGQKQRVAIARALIKKPKMILADEPTGNLDKNSSEQIFRILKEISKNYLVVVVSHDMERAISYADRIVKIEDGKVISDSDTELNDNIQPMELKKSKLPLSYALKMSITSFKSKPFKLFMTILLTTISLIFMGFTVNCAMFNKGMFISNTMKDNKNYTYDIYYQKINADGSGNPINFKNKDYKNIEKLTNSKINKAYSLYDNEQELSFEYGNLKNVSAYYNHKPSIFSFIEVEDDRLFKNILGRKPKNQNELVIHEYLADYILKFGVMDSNNKIYYPTSYNDLVSSNRNIKLGNNKVVITGIIKDDSSMFNKKSSKFQNEELSKYYDEYTLRGNIIYVKGFTDNVILRKDNNSIYKKSVLRKDNEELSRKITPLKEETEIITENGINKINKLNKNEVVLSLDTLKLLDDSFVSIYNMYLTTNNKIDTPDTLNEFIPLYLKEKQQNKLNVIYDIYTEKATGYNNLRLNLIGITFDENNYVSFDFAKDYDITTKKVNFVRIYDDNINHLRKVFNKISLLGYNNLSKKPDKYYVANINNVSDMYNVIATYKGLYKYILIISLVFILFTFLLFSNFISVSISYCKKEIGILRSLGARNIDVIKIFGYESIIISILSWGLSVISWYIICAILNVSLFGDKYYILNGIVTHPLVPIIMLLYTLLIAIFITCSSVSRITKIKPIDAILNK